MCYLHVFPLFKSNAYIHFFYFPFLFLEFKINCLKYKFYAACNEKEKKITNFFAWRAQNARQLTLSVLTQNYHKIREKPLPYTIDTQKWKVEQCRHLFYCVKILLLLLHNNNNNNNKQRCHFAISTISYLHNLYLIHPTTHSIHCNYKINCTGAFALIFII